jgi:hypothetical protein
MINAKSDYHDNMDGPTWEKYVRNRLVPAFRARYPGCTMILNLDNAPYHLGVTEGCVSLTAPKGVTLKNHLVQQLQQVCEVTEFAVVRKDNLHIIFSSSSDWKKNALRMRLPPQFRAERRA